MNIDAVALDDLHIFKGANSVFNLLDKCLTKNGSLFLKEKLKYPLNDIDAICAMQQAILFWADAKRVMQWQISNGTIVMLEQYLEESEFSEAINNNVSLYIQLLYKKIFHKEYIEHVKFLYEQIAYLLKDTLAIFEFYKSDIGTNIILRKDYEIINNAFDNAYIKVFQLEVDEVPLHKMILHIHQIRRYAKNHILNLIAVIANADMLINCARWCNQDKWTMPIFIHDVKKIFEAKAFFHPILSHPVAYDLILDSNENIVVLTGANMSGKTTFMRAIGIINLLAHCGFPVPAKEFKLSKFDGFISQIMVQDDIEKGESYFYAEVQQIKNTAQKLQQNTRNLVILDELFKGTNVYDAYDCTLAILNGMKNKSNNLIIISTHLHELVNKIKEDKSFTFKYLETIINDQHQYNFTYKLKDGVSQDRIGFSLLKQEGVLDLLK